MINCSNWNYVKKTTRSRLYQLIQLNFFKFKSSLISFICLKYHSKRNQHIYKWLKNLLFICHCYLFHFHFQKNFVWKKCPLWQDKKYSTIDLIVKLSCSLMMDKICNENEKQKDESLCTWEYIRSTTPMINQCSHLQEIVIQSCVSCPRSCIFHSISTCHTYWMWWVFFFVCYHHLNFNLVGFLQFFHALKNKECPLIFKFS